MRRGIFILVSAIDNIHYNGTFGIDTTRSQDRLELYFNTNVGKFWGPAENTNGRYQVSVIVEDSTGMPTNFSGGHLKFYRDTTSANYNFELFMPWTAIPDSLGNVFVPDGNKEIGFDIYMCDNDGPNDPDGSNFDRTRIVWSNDGAFGVKSECMINMTDAGLIKCLLNYVNIDAKKVLPVYFVPNPAKEVIKIQNISERAFVSIYNIQGKLILSKTVVNNEQINISNFSEGIYLIKISDSHNIWMDKMIKR